MSDRSTEVAESEYAGEKEVLDYLRRQLRGHEPCRAWPNVEFVAANGFIDGVDALAVGRSRLRLVETKSRLGQLTADRGTWTRHTEAGRPLLVDDSCNLANLGAKSAAVRIMPAVPASCQEAESQIP